MNLVVVARGQRGPKSLPEKDHPDHQKNPGKSTIFVSPEKIHQKKTTPGWSFSGGPFINL